MSHYQYFSDIVQWNPRGIRNKLRELEILAEYTRALLFCIQETKLPEDGTITLRGFKAFYKNKILGPGEIAHGGVAILASNKYSSSEIKLNTNLQAVAISIKLFKRITICSLYCPPGPCPQSFLKDIENLLDQLPKPFMVLGDFNAHHPLWFGSYADGRGKAIEKIIMERDVYFLDKNKDTHFYNVPNQNQVKTSHIDLSLCSISLCLDFEWGLFDQPMESDHFPIWLRSGRQRRPASLPKWVINKANWTAFTGKAIPQMKVNEMASSDEMNDYCKSFIVNAAKETIPKTTGNETTYKSPWWNKDCRVVKRDRRKAWDKFLSGEFTLPEFNLARAKARQTFNWSKKQSWIRFMESINGKTSPKEVWSKIGILTKKYKSHTITTLKAGDQIFDDPQQIADKLGENYAKVSSFSNCSPNFLRYKRLHEKEYNFATSENLPYNSPISKWELDSALAASSDSAVGQDEIHNRMLKNLSEEGKKYLLDFFNYIFSEGVLPDDWKLAYIIPILKEGKDPLDATSYRPISLLSCLSKLFGRIMNRRLVWFLQRGNCLDKAQNGFQKGKCSQDSLVAFEDEIHDAFVLNQLLVGILFDLEKAYDTCWGNLILRELHSVGLRGNLAIIISDYLANRRFQVIVGNKISRVYRQEMGVPQGGILSVTLFIVAMNTVVAYIGAEISFGLYVDDLRVSIRVARLCLAERRLNLLLQRLQVWMDQTGFKLSATKTKAIIFRRGSRWSGLQNTDLKLKLNNHEIEVVSVAKFLGLLFDEKLTWKPHIDNLKRKCTKGLNAMKLMAKFSKVGDCLFYRRIYRTLYRPIFDYGAPIYGTAGASYLRRLDSVHHSFLRLCSGAYRTSNRESLYVEVNEPSLQNRRLLLDLQYFFRAQRIPDNNKVISWEDSGLDEIYDQRSNPYFKPKSYGYKTRKLIRHLHIPMPKIIKIRYYHIPPWLFTKINICFSLAKFVKTETPDELYQQEFQSHKHMADLEIYTDGSKIQSKVGSGYVIKRGNSVRKVPLRVRDHSSVFVAELFAIRVALLDIKKYRDLSCIIYSDSRSALQAIEKLYSDHPLVQVIQESVFKYSQQGLFVSFCWVPSHVGIEGNTLADESAKAGCFLSTVALNEITASDFKVFLKDKIVEKWQKKWDRLININKTPLTEIQPLVNQNRHIPGLSRIELLKLTRLRIGHTKFAKQHLVKNEEAEECIETGDLLSVKHVLLECGEYYYERQRFFGNGYIDMREILNPTDAPGVRNLLNFFREIGLFHRI